MNYLPKDPKFKGYLCRNCLNRDKCLEACFDLKRYLEATQLKRPIKRPKYINKPFQRLPIKKRACLILHLAGLSAYQIAKVIGLPRRTISRYIKEGYKEYPNEFGLKLDKRKDK